MNLKWLLYDVEEGAHFDLLFLDNGTVIPVSPRNQKQLRTPLERLSPAIWTGTSTLDVLLNHTRNRPVRAGIHFTVQADALDLKPMEDQPDFHLTTEKGPVSSDH